MVVYLLAERIRRGRSAFLPLMRTFPFRLRWQQYANELLIRYQVIPCVATMRATSSHHRHGEQVLRRLLPKLRCATEDEKAGCHGPHGQQRGAGRQQRHLDNPDDAQLVARRPPV